MTAVLEYGYRSVRITGPYNPAWVEEVKTEIPGNYRTYEPLSRVWTVYDPYVLVVVQITRELFNQVSERNRERYDDGKAASPPRSPGSQSSGIAGDPDFAVLYLRDDAPEVVGKAVYKVLATTLHPDRGGQEEAMKTLNAAWDRIRAKRGWT